LDHDVKLGELISNSERRRDAIHIAVAPVTADEMLRPGDHVGFSRRGSTEFVSTSADRWIGIVDPFLRDNISRGQRFWLCLYPGSITGLRHAWTHPAFTAVSEQLRKEVGF
jgi:hypothetical protein